MHRFGIIFAAFAVLAGCTPAAQPVPQTLVLTKTIYVPWVFPAYLRNCAGDVPAVIPPHVLADDQEAGSKIAHYTAAERANFSSETAAHDDCANTLAAAVAAAATSGATPKIVMPAIPPAN